jgi:hypothetical protein
MIEPINPSVGRVPGRGVGAVGKWPAVATVQSLTEGIPPGAAA